LSYLHAANQRIFDIILEELSSLVVLACPTPDILSVAVVLRGLQYDGTDNPHDDTENEKSHGEGGVVNCDFLCSPVTATEISIEHGDRGNQ